MSAWVRRLNRQGVVFTRAALLHALNGWQVRESRHTTQKSLIHV